MTAPMLINGAMNGEAFVAYVEQCLAPTLERGDIVIMDNVRKSGLDSPDSVECARYFSSDGQAALATTASMPNWRCVGEVKPRSRRAGRRRRRA
jgi:hypothetical protein